MITIDGSQGEGGGQILRTALALSMTSGQAFRIRRLRAGRARPGLLRQHLTALRAAAEICSARVEGAVLGSAEVVFRPGAVQPGSYRFAVGSAGSAGLVLQAVLPALLTAAAPSVLQLEGGTHNPWAPPFAFLQKAYLPLLGRMGPQVTAELARPGFHPAGGGRFEVTVAPVARLNPFALLQRGAVVARRAQVLVAHLPRSIAERERTVVTGGLGLPATEIQVREVRDSVGPGNVVWVEVQSEYVTEVFTGFGRRGVPAETVAGEVLGEVDRYLAAGVPVGGYLADQLLLPLALAGGGAFRTVAPSSHCRTNARVIQSFLDLPVCFVEEAQDVWAVEVGRAC